MGMGWPVRRIFSISFGSLAYSCTEQALKIFSSDRYSAQRCSLRRLANYLLSVLFLNSLKRPTRRLAVYIPWVSPMFKIGVDHKVLTTL
jgi:hypothetical protein